MHVLRKQFYQDLPDKNQVQEILRPENGVEARNHHTCLLLLLM